MKNINRKLQVEQLDKKIKAFNKLETFSPSQGWIYATRIALGMSLEQLGKKMGVSAQAIRGFEQREKNDTLSLKVLNEAAHALNLKLVYGFAVNTINAKSLEKMIELKAHSLAEKIVLRTHKTMQLEDQANSRARLRKAIKTKTQEIIDKNIKLLWN